MKKLITILIVLISISIYAQRDIEVKYISHYNAGYVIEDADEYKVDWMGWESIEMEAVFDYDNGLISITNAEKTKLSVIKSIDVYYRVDSDKDSVKVSRFRAYDQNNDILRVNIHRWKSDDSMLIYLYYDTYAVLYQTW